MLFQILKKVTFNELIRNSINLNYLEFIFWSQMEPKIMI